MRVNDNLIAAFLVCLGFLIGAHAMNMPPIPGQDYGADVFPKLASVGLIGCGLALFFLRRDSAVTSEASTRLGLRGYLHVLVPLAAIGGFVIAAPRLGFVAASALLLFALQIFADVRWLTATIVSMALSALTYHFFAKILQVPLPPGVLWW